MPTGFSGDTDFIDRRGRFNYSLDDFGGAVPIDQSVLLGGYDASGVTLGEFNLITLNTPILRLGNAQDSYNRQINIVDNLSVVRGAHNLKFGFDYRRLMPTYGHGRVCTLCYCIFG